MIFHKIAFKLNLAKHQWFMITDKLRNGQLDTTGSWCCYCKLHR